MKKEQAEKLDRTIKKINQLSERRFWGMLTIKFEEGVPVHVEILEKIKP